jgi:flagellar hook-basal body complex protein FliE
MSMPGISGVNASPLSLMGPLKGAGSAADPAKAGADLFGKMLSGAMETLNDLQANADGAAAALAAGKDVELHDVIIAQEQSSMAFQFAMQVRNKVVDAYQEVMRMQV